MRKSLKTGLALVMGIPFVAGTALIATACDSSVSYENTITELSSIVKKLETSTEFSKDFDLSVYQGKNNGSFIKMATLKTIIPEYDQASSESKVNSKITQEADAGNLNNKYVKIRMLYDASWAYSYSLFERNYNLLSSKKLKNLSSSQQNAANNLNKEATNFLSQISKQEKSIKILRTTLYDLGVSYWDSSLAYNVLYNYEKDYKTFVRSAISLATASTNLVEEVFAKDYYAEVKSSEIVVVEEEKEKNNDNTETTEQAGQPAITKRLSDRYSLEVLDAYFTLFVDEIGLNGYDNSTYVGEKCYDIYKEYLTFMATLFEGISGESMYVERVTLSEVETLESELPVISQQYSDTKKTIQKIDLEDINSNRNGDAARMSKDEVYQFEYINAFYRDILINWWSDYANKLFKNGVKK